MSMTRSRNKFSKPSATTIAQLEVLVDELIKDQPHEPKIRTCMEAAGLIYTHDPIARMKTVLSALDRMRGPRAEREI